MSRTSRLPDAPEQYSRHSEAEFRRALEQELAGAYGQLASATPAAHTHAGETIRPAAITVGADAAPNASAVIDMAQQTTKGLLPPKLTTAQRDAISGPATGLFIFNTTTARYEWYDGAAWSPVASLGETLLTEVEYAPGSDTSVTRTATAWDSTSYIDATNLRVQFTAPANGIRLIVEAMLYLQVSGAVTTALHLAFQQNSGPYYSVRTGTELQVLTLTSQTTGTARSGSRVYYEQKNTSYSGAQDWLLGMRVASSGTAGLRHGPTFGKTRIQVWGLP